MKDNKEKKDICLNRTGKTFEQLAEEAVQHLPYPEPEPKLYDEPYISVEDISEEKNRDMLLHPEKYNHEEELKKFRED